MYLRFHSQPCHTRSWINNNLKLLVTIRGKLEHPQALIYFSVRAYIYLTECDN